MKKLFLTLFGLFLFAVSTSQVFALSLDVSTNIKNYTDGTLYEPGDVNIDPDEDIIIKFTITNNSGETANNVVLTPSSMLNGEINQSATNSANKIHVGGWKTASEFQVNTNTQSQVNYSYGALADGGTITAYVPFNIPSTYNTSSATFTLTPSCDNSCTVAGSASRTFSVNVAPTLSSASFSSALTNDGSATASLTVDATDPAGISDVSTVTIDLTSIGGSSAFALADDGASGDGASGDGTWGGTGVTTTVSAGSYTLTLTATDSNGNQGTTTVDLTVQTAGNPVVTKNSQTRDSVSTNSGYTTSVINWESNLNCGTGGSQGYRVVNGGTAGDPDTGTIITDWQSSGCSAGVAQDTTINQSDLNTGSNTVYIYVKTSDNNVGYLAASIEKDLTAPTITEVTYTALLDASSNGSIGWYANEAGTYTVRVGGTSGTPTSGTQVTGTNASGSYSSAQASSSSQISSQYLNADISEGANTLYVHFTDAVGNISSHQFGVTKDSTGEISPPLSISLADNDNAASGVDGNDFTVTWTESGDTANTGSYQIYIYQSSDSYVSGDTVIATASVGTTSYTGNGTITTDSKGNALAAGDYRAVMIALAINGYDDSGTGYSANATIASDDTNPPAFVSASFVSDDRIKITFDRTLSTTLSAHDATQISSGDFTVNTALGTNGIEQVSGSNIFVHINALNNSGATSTDLDFAATYQEDATEPTTHDKPITVAFVTAANGTKGPVADRGTFDAGTAIENGSVNVDGAVNNNSVSDGQAPNPLSITAPTDSTQTNSTSLSFQYSLPEAMNSSTLKVKFTRTGGATDSNSPYTISLSGASSGAQTEVINLTSFTSDERGASDSLNNESVYQIELSGSDTAGNIATTVSVSDFMYDTTAPGVVALQRFPSGAPQNAYWTTDNTPLLQWSASTDTNGIDHYVADISAFSDFSVISATSGNLSGVTQWQVPSTLTDGQYYWRVLAYDPAGNASSAQTTTESFIVDTTGPSISVNGTPTTRTLSQISIALDAASDGSTGVGNNISGYTYSLFKADSDCTSNASTTSYSTDTTYDFTSLTANTTLCFKARAKDGLGNEGDFSATQTVTTLANQVTGFSGVVSYPSDHRIILNWTSQGQSGVKIEQDANCDGTYETTPLDSASTAATSHTIDSGLSGNTCYQFRIDSYNADGALNGSSLPTTQSTTLPDVPTSLSNNANTDSSVTFDWDDLSGATSYNVYETDSSGNNANLIANPTVSTYAITGVAANTQKCVIISANASAGEGSTTSHVCAYSSANIPQNLSHSTQTTSGITWTWQSGGAQAAYNAFTNTPSDSSGWGSFLTWAQTTLSTNTAYQAFVKARNADGDETATINTTVYTAIEDPTQTFGTVTATSIEATTTVSNIGSGSSAVFFENTTASTNSGYIATSTWNNTGLTPNTQYTYQVKARNGDADETSFSATASQYTLAAVPDLIVGESVTDTQISVRIDGNDNPNGTQYQIYRSTTGTGNPTSNPGDWAQVQDWTAHNDNDSFFDTSLTASTTYYYIAQTRNDDTPQVESGWGTAQSAATDSGAVKIEETSGTTVNTWYNGASLDLTFHINSTTGIAYYRYIFDNSSSTDIDADSYCIDTSDANLKKWGDSGSAHPSGGIDNMSTDLTHSLTSTGSYYAHFIACASGLDATPGTADDVRVSNITNPQLDFGAFQFDNSNPTISDDYGSDGVLVAPSQTVTLSPADTGAGVDEVRYCLDDATNDCDPFSGGIVLSSPYQFTYSTTVDQYVRYAVQDLAGNTSATDSYHVMVDADAPVISSVTPEKTSGTIKSATDNVYAAGDTVRIKAVESNTETGLTGTVQIVSVNASYDSGAQAVAYDGTNDEYYYDWDTTGLTEAADYTVTVTLTDSVSNSATDNGTVIQIDNSVPTTDTFTIEDTTSSSTTLTNSRTITVSALTGSDSESGISFYLVADEDGDVAAPAKTVADFSATSAPGTYDLVGTEGTLSVFAWVMDKANNIATALKQLITLDLTNPTVNSFTIADQTSGSTTYTNSTTINVTAFTASDTNGITRYLINESATTPTVSDMNSSGSGTAQTTYTITGGEGSRTIYAWVMDGAENIDSTNTSITYDITAPTVTSVSYLDNDQDGQIDRVRVQFSESLTNSGTSISNGAGMTVAGHSISAGTGVVSTTTNSNDTLTLTIDETGVDTANMPDFTYASASGNIQDLAENTLANVASGDILESDGVAPVKTSMTMNDTDADGRVDQVIVTYSEPLVAVADDSANWTLSNIPSNGSKGTVTATNGVNDVTINITEGVSPQDTSVSTFTVAYTNAGAIQDAVGNTALSFTAESPIDGAKPVFLTRTTQDLDSNGKIDAMRVTLSESISDITITATDFTLETGNSRSIDSTYTNTFGSLTFTNGVATGSGSDDAEFYLKVSEGTLVDTGDTPTLTYTAGSLAESAATALTVDTNSSMTSSDGVVPVLSSVTLKDSNSDGDIETAELIFTEEVDDSSLTVGGWSIGGSAATTFSTTVEGDADVDDDRITVSLTSGVSGTSLDNADITYTSATGGLTDLNGNALVDRGSSDTPAEVDAADPVIISAVYSDAGTESDASDDSITITFSEEIDDSTLDTSAGGSDTDFAVFGGGDITNATTSTGSSADDEVIEVELNAGDTALTPAVSAVALVSGAVSDLATSPNASTSTDQVTTNGAIIINEIMWGGTSGSTTDDEYVELRNMSASAVDFSTTNHAIYINGSFWKLLNSGTIPGSGYFIISRYDSDDGASTLLNINDSNLNHIKDAALTAIPDTALQIKIYQGVDDTGILLDTADDGAGAPFAGSASTAYKAMERNDAPGDGAVASNWHTADGSVNFTVSSVFGTPKSVNISDGQAPSFDTSPDSRTPTPNTLRPDVGPTMSVDYSDNVGGSGIDTSEVYLYLDLDQNTSTSGTVGSTTLTGCETDKTSSSTITATSVSLTPSAALPHGRYRVCVLIKDVAGNEATTSWDYWIDNFTMTVSETAAARMNVTPTVTEETADGVSKITITTYGAAFDVSASFPTLGTGGNTIDKTDVAYDSLLDKKVGSGSFVQQHGYDGYLNMNDNTAVESVSAETDLQSNPDLKTYEIELKYRVDVNAIQQAGVYTGNVDYQVNVTY